VIDINTGGCYHPVPKFLTGYQLVMLSLKSPVTSPPPSRFNHSHQCSRPAQMGEGHRNLILPAMSSLLLSRNLIPRELLHAHHPAADLRRRWGSWRPSRLDPRRRRWPRRPPPCSSGGAGYQWSSSGGSRWPRVGLDCEPETHELARLIHSLAQLGSARSIF
jgi:hypothetical protein